MSYRRITHPRRLILFVASVVAYAAMGAVFKWFDTPAHFVMFSAWLIGSMFGVLTANASTEDKRKTKFGNDSYNPLSRPIDLTEADYEVRIQVAQDNLLSAQRDLRDAMEDYSRYKLDTAIAEARQTRDEQLAAQQALDNDPIEIRSQENNKLIAYLRKIQDDSGNAEDTVDE